MSRPSKLNAERQQIIADALAEGHSIANASTGAGISERTYHHWTARGLAEQERLDTLDTEEDPLESEEPYLQFLRETARALATFEAELVGDLKRVARGYEIEESGKDGETYYRTAIDWRAGAWLLERKFPDRYGSRQRHELTGADGGPIQSQTEPVMDLSKLSPAELKQLMELKRKALEGDAS